MVRRRPTSYRTKRPIVRKGIRSPNDDNSRKIILGKLQEQARYPDNKIISSKYTIWTFIPKNLYEQFRRIANFYFLCMAVIAFAITSPVSPLTSLLPLIFVVTVTGIKQAYEDYLRHRADREVNNFMVTVMREGEEKEVQSQKIQVGDIVRVNDEQDIPCDMVLLVSSHKESKCFVTTANLDGETNLKTLYCPKSLKRTLTLEELGKLDATVDAESPTADLYKFHGRLEYGVRTSSSLRQSIIKREKSFFRPAGPSCCYKNCNNCPFKRKKDEFSGGTEYVRCDCQCRTRGVETPAVSEDDETNQVLQEFEEKLHALEEGLDKEQITTRRSSSLSTASAALPEEPLSKMNSNPEMGRNDGAKDRVDSLKSAMRKTHRKTDSNVSRVSFKVDLEPRMAVPTSGPWTLDKKASILSRRNSSLLSSKRPSLATAEGGIADPLSAENLLLRGARLRNTSYVYGCAVYTGQDTKLALNSKLTSNKFSTVERSVNKFLIFYLLLMLMEVVVSTILKSLRESDIGMGASAVREKKFKVHLLKAKKSVSPWDVVEDFFSFIVLYNYVIPISLYVTMEMQKFLGTLFFEWDLNMFDAETEEAAICNTSDLNEDLGQVEFLFTDKTGTLTENKMLFRRCSIDGVTYLQRNAGLYELHKDDIAEEPVDLSTCEVAMEHFLLALSLCHTVQVEEKPNDETSGEQLIKFNAASPDEKALVEAMQRLDIVFTNDEDDLIVLRIFGQEKIYKRLDVLEFTSDRKRMSVIVEDEENNIFLYCKGAESAVLPQVSYGPTDDTLQHVADFASRGLRTLTVAYKSITHEEYDHMTMEIQRARQTLSSDREAIVAKTYQTVEAGLTILGATGVEDRLQDKVRETLESLRSAGIKVWILTGDKVETAVNISMSCGHFDSSMVKLQLTGRRNEEECREALLMYRHKITSNEDMEFGLVVDGESLKIVLKESESLLFREVCLKCSAVICCRMSPLQKSEVVHLIKHSPLRPVTAAIGDGANDVSMIQEAHVGLGIMGKEGRQAVRCADFAFARFKFLREVLLVHGHWYYLRVCTLVQYFFYKNIAFILPQFYFIFFNGFSTQPLYDSMYLTCYNIFFTSLPVLLYGLLEQNYSAESLRQSPALYSIHSKNSLMTWRHFFKWFTLGLWHSLVIFFVPYFWIYHNCVARPDGLEIYLELLGTQIFHSSVVVVNLKLWLHSRYWSWPFMASIAFSFASWLIIGSVYSLINLVVTADIYFTFINMLATPNLWLMSLLVAVICLVPDLVIGTILNHSLSLPRRPRFSFIPDLRKKTKSELENGI